MEEEKELVAALADVYGGAPHLWRSCLGEVSPGECSCLQLHEVDIIPPGVTSITTDIDGSTTLVPIMSGGDVSSAIILTPTTIIAPSGTEASSSKGEIETQLSN